MDKDWTVKWYNETDSTNAEAERLLEVAENVANMTVIASRWQSAGRGQGDHLWHSRPGENLTFTAILKEPPVPARDQSSISMATALAVTEYLEDKGIRASIKLPNDIYVDGRKICGLLIRHHVQGSRICSSLLGIGLNLLECDFPAELPNPVSVRILRPEFCSTPEKELPLLLEKLTRKLELLVSLHILEEEFNSKLL